VTEGDHTRCNGADWSVTGSTLSVTEKTLSAPDLFEGAVYEVVHSSTYAHNNGILNYSRVKLRFSCDRAP
jgi:hypothetical protein